MSRLEEFQQCLNANNKGIELTWHVSPQKNNFLDFEIEIKENSLITSTHFKSTDRNGYIPKNSCHHRPWLDNIPTVEGNCSV